jgi:ubiquinone/menaquinone biosynthesis C-methylase UbiE
MGQNTPARKTVNYYNSISKGYDELYGEEQIGKVEGISHIGGNSVLDVGCGTSILTRRLKAGFRVGIDSSKGMVLKGRAPGIRYVVGLAERLPFKNGSFDHVVSVSVVQDVENPRQVLAEMARVGGKITVSAPMKSKINLKNLVSELNLAVSSEKTAGKDRFLYISK